VASLGRAVALGEEPRYIGVVSHYTLEHNPLLELAEKVKEGVKAPVITAGGFNLPEDAEAALERGAADMVAVGRAYLADCAWGYHARRGRPQDIRPCLKCNRCHIEMLAGHVTRCAVNPHLGEVDERDCGRAARPRRVAVVGSGPGGIQAALTAAARGHRVTLVEKDDELGGNLRIGCLPFFKEDVRRYLDYLKHSLEGSGVEVVLGREADVEYLENLEPEAVIVAAGAGMAPLSLPGGEKALPVVEVLAGRAPVGERVLIIGAGFVGCEVGWHLAREGHQVQLLDMLPEEKLLAEEHPVNRATLFYQLQQAGVPLALGAEPKRITDQGALVGLHGGEEKLFKADSVVSSVGFTPRRELYQKLLAEKPEWDVYAVGDCVEVGNFFHATQAAFQAARRL